MPTPRPAEHPRWATNPPGSTITAPTTLQQQEGWQPAGSVTFPEGKPVRQIQNWMDNLNGDWAAWFDQVTHRTSDLHPNHALPGGVAPSLGAGLVIATDSFSARVYADGYAVSSGLGSLIVPCGAQANYTASRDTYWDLSRDGVWTRVVVANGAGEPAVTANSTRVYMVVTNATDRTTLTDYRRARTRLSTHDVVANVRYALEDTLDNPGGSSDAERRTAKRTTTVDSTSGATYELIEEELGNNSIDPIRVYSRMVGGQLSKVIVIGARCTSTSGTVAWIAESTIAYRWVIAGLAVEFAEISGLTADVTTFNDSVWSTPTAANAARLRRNVSHGQRISIDPSTVGTNANLTADLEHVRRDSRYTLIDKEVLQAGTDTGQREYFTGNALGTSLVMRAFAYNCRWDDNASGWARDAGGDAYLVLFGSSGYYVLRHDASLGATWSDVIGASDWATEHYAGRPLALTGGRSTCQRLIPEQVGTGVTPIANALYQANVPKAWCNYTWDGATGLMIGSAFNVSGIAWDGATMSARLTLATPLTGLSNGAVHANYDANGLGNPYRFCQARIALVNRIDIQHIEYTGTQIAQNISSHGSTHVVVYGLE